MSKRPRPPASPSPAAGAGTDPRTAPALGLRRAPVQSRGHAAFERVLETTAILLEEVGPDALTTNLIADRSRLNIATLYKYFPNKQAILAELFRRQNLVRQRVGAERVAAGDAGKDWRAGIDQTVDEVVRVAATQRAYRELRLAMRSSPELQAVEDQFAESMAAAMAESFAQRTGLAREDARVVARCVYEISMALFDHWARCKGREADRVVQQIKAVLKGYLGQYFEGR